MQANLVHLLDLVVVGLLLGCLNCGPQSVSDRLPDSVLQWRQTSTEAYDRQGLYDYMDGGAELYHSFGFQHLTVHRYSAPEQPDIVLEVYEMDSPANAYGIFAHDRLDSSIGIGQDSEFGEGWLRFWKGKYYVSIFAEEENDSANQAVLELGRKVAEAIRQPGERPHLLTWLPKEGRIETGVRYFHDHVSLNHYCYVSRENILRLGKDVEGVLARYQTGNEQTTLAIIRYPTAEQAESALRDFAETYLQAAPDQRWAERAEGEWAGAERLDSILLLVLKAPSREVAEKLSQAALNLIREDQR